LRSTLFDTEAIGDSVLIHGTGFGHGVGLCQEGAMQMAFHGWKYQEILHFYYKGVEIKYMQLP